MFKWRSKNKFKSVFLLQFQATQVPPSKKPGVTIALVPEDIGKPTVKLEKAPIVDGTCSWDNPVYETVKLVRDPKTAKIKEKIYHFIVSTGSSKSGFLGEASIDFADFAMETEALTFSLPLKFANSGAVLHVTILKMGGPDDQREMEENEAVMENGATRASSATLASSWDIPCEENLMLRKGAGLSKGSNTDWSVGSASDGSLVDSSNSLEDNVARERSHEVSDEKLKGEIALLMNQASVSELELQTLRRQIVKETKRGQTQSSEIVSLRDERDFFKKECEQLKSVQKYNEEQVRSQLKLENRDLTDLVEEIKKELDLEEDSNSSLRMQLQEMQDSNSKLVLAARELNEMLGQKNEEIDRLSQKIETSRSLEELKDVHQEQNGDEEIDSLKQKIADLSGEIEAYRKHKDNLAIYVEQLTVENEILKQENQKTTSELERKLQNANEELERTKDQNAAQLQELSSNIHSKVKEIDQMALELDDKTKQLEYVKMDEREKHGAFSMEIRSLRAEIERLKQDKYDFSRKEEPQREGRTEEIKTSAGEIELLTDIWNKEREDLENKFASARMEAETLLAELMKLRSNKDENETLIRKLQSEKQSIRTQYSRLKDRVIDEDLEKENMRKEVFQLKDELQKKETEISRIERKLKDNGMETKASEASMASLKKNLKLLEEEVKLKEAAVETARNSYLEKETNLCNTITKLENKVEQLKHTQRPTTDAVLKEATCVGMTVDSVGQSLLHSEMSTAVGMSPWSERKVQNKVSNAHYSDESNVTELLSELTILKERNKSMECDLKEMQERYTEISLKFAEVEGERQQLVMTVRNLKNGKKN